MTSLTKDLAQLLALAIAKQHLELLRQVTRQIKQCCTEAEIKLILQTVRPELSTEHMNWLRGVTQM